MFHWLRKKPTAPLPPVPFGAKVWPPCPIKMIDKYDCQAGRIIRNADCQRCGSPLCFDSGDQWECANHNCHARFDKTSNDNEAKP